MKSIKVTIFLAILLTWLPKANAYSEKIAYRTWQGIVDGKPSEGSFFYRFNILNDSTIEINRQAKNENITEFQNWALQGNYIAIKSDSTSRIKKFNGEKLKFVDKKNILYSNDFYRTNFKPYYKSFSYTQWILTVFVLIILNELFRKSKYFTIFFFVILPIILTPTIWVKHDVNYWFKWVKLYSVVLAAIWFTAIRYTSLAKYTWARLIAALFLAANIAEAVM